VKHTGATKGLLSLRKVGGSVLLSVSDNGKGFDPESTGAHGTGLSSIRNRISLYGGRMKITSKPGKGTTVNIKLQNIRMQ
jgi:signal transduction histidine kinase